MLLYNKEIKASKLFWTVGKKVICNEKISTKAGQMRKNNTTADKPAEKKSSLFPVLLLKLEYFLKHSFEWRGVHWFSPAGDIQRLVKYR
jgi:hypothetical protein